MSKLSPDDLEYRLAKLETLLVVGRQLASTLELPKLLDLIANSARQMTDCEASSILLLDMKSGELYFEAASGGAESIKRVVVPIDSSVAGWVCLNGEPLLIADTAQDDRFYKQADVQSSFTTRSILGVPLKVKDTVIGCLEAVNKKEGTPFNGDDIETLTTLAAHAAVAIQNARLFQQSDQISEMVHELRTPLTGIVAYSELLMRPDLPPGMVPESARTINEEATRLAQFINDFLDLSRLESGRARISCHPVDLGQLAHEVVQVMQPQAAKRGVTVSCEVTENLPLVSGDPQRLKQVLINLISNSIKYNRPDGAVQVLVAVEADAVRVQVKDTGKGIPAEALPRLFDKFYRVADAEGWAQGTGLGLSIVKQLVEAHNSHIEVASQVGVGTTMQFKLPALAAPVDSRP